MLYQQVSPFRHPQVCTPVFHGCRLGSTICPPGASRVSSGEGYEGIARRREGVMYLKKHNVSIGVTEHVFE
jgi:hypothetical protein